MDAFIQRKRRRSPSCLEKPQWTKKNTPIGSVDEESTDFKLGILASLHPRSPQSLLLDVLLAFDGAVEAASEALSSRHDGPSSRPPRKKAALGSLSYQSSLTRFALSSRDKAASYAHGTPSPKPLTKKGKTLHLYSPADVAAHTPCSIIHNFLPADTADDLLREMLAEAPTFGKMRFKLFDNVVESPHSSCFYVDSKDEQRKQTTEYLYNGSYLGDVRQLTPHLRQVSTVVQHTVNKEIARRSKSHYANGQKLKYQSPKEWIPNAAFVNCYDGGGESVGYHSDQLTYLGPRAIIGSLSLGVSREFRVRKVIPREEATSDNVGQNGDAGKKDDERADAEGQISIHLPHNSLLVMHAEMQEEWKHSIHPSLAIDPHPIAGKKRINITYRCYRDSFHPRYTPKCKCNVPTVLRCVQKKKTIFGRYMWMCHAGYTPGKEG
ncbi:MAG: hypothetical protein M1819_003525 [Sarea resinae]|nr:MAG: hypothetical protein M1819_003525 [Sarea resinae]